MRALIRLDQDKTALAALIETSPLQAAAVGGASPLIQREGPVMMEMAQGQVIDAASAQGAQGNRFRIGNCIALPDLSVKHHDVDAGGIKFRGSKYCI